MTDPMELRVVGGYAPPPSGSGGSLTPEQLSSIRSEADLVALPASPLATLPLVEDRRGRRHVLIRTGEGSILLPYISPPGAGRAAQPDNGTRSAGSSGDTTAAPADQSPLALAVQAIQSFLTGGGTPATPAATPVPLPSDLDNPPPLTGPAEDLSAPASNRGTWAPDQNPVSSFLSSLASFHVTGRISSAAADSILGKPDADSGAEDILAHEYATQVLSEAQGMALESAVALVKGDGMVAPDLVAKVEEFFAGTSSSAQHPALRVCDADLKGNAIAAGACSVEIECMPAAREGDPVMQKGVLVAGGIGNVLVAGQPIGRAMTSASAEAMFMDGACSVLVGDEPPPPKEPPKTPPVDVSSQRKSGQEQLDHRLLFPVPPVIKQLFVDEKTQNWLLLGGLIDLGSPEVPGAGTTLTWWIPDRILGWDMSKFFVFHDSEFFKKDWTLADFDEVFSTEIEAFRKGLQPDPIHLALQVIYSSATTIVGTLKMLYFTVEAALQAMLGIDKESK